MPGGFTPFLDGAQDDASFVVGINGEFDSGMLYDFSYNYGKNELDYFLNNTVNPDLALVGTCPACEIRRGLRRRRLRAGRDVKRRFFAADERSLSTWPSVSRLARRLTAFAG